MKKFQGNIDKIEGYLEGTLDHTALKEVEEALANDKDFKKELESHKFLLDGIKYTGRNELHEKMKVWDKELSDEINLPETGAKHNTIKWYAVAASIVFFVVAGIIISVNLENGYQNVVTEYYKPHNLIPPTTRGEKSIQNSLDEIYQSYENAGYDHVISSINQLDPALKTDDVTFLLANSHQAIGEYDAAIQIFEEFSNSDTGYKSASQWYMALCLLSKDNIDQAIPILEKLSTSNTSYESDAKSILEELE